MIRLSASLLKDFLACPRKVYYRINASGQEVQTNEMAVGSIVHEVIEKNWNNEKTAYELSANLIRNYGLPDEQEKANKMIASFFAMFPKDFFNDKDKIESYFKIPYRKDVVLTGKIDRIHDGIVYDWKTGKAPPDDINKDPQFILYYLAYKRLFNEEPKTLCYVSLANKKIYYFSPIPQIIDEFENKLIPDIVSSIKSNNFPREGLFEYKICERDPKHKCPFKDLCWGELGLSHDE